MRRLLALLALVLLSHALTANSAYAQANNAAIGGVVQDTTKALIPGVTITLTNTATGVVDTRLTNDSGAYNFPSVPPGVYKLTGDLTGFRSAVQNSVQLGTAAQVRIDLTLQVGAGAGDTVQVTLDADNRIQESAASVGDVLTDKRLHDLPVVGNNVLDLLTVLPGFRVSAAGAQFDTVGGMGLDSVNTTINGLSTNSSRDSAQLWGYQTFTTTVVNPDLVGEIRLILAPVDAELGRGNSQIQIQTRSGTNKYTGAAVWNIQNSALNANSWLLNHTPTLVNGIQTSNSTKPDWQNVQQITASIGGPIIKNKTFFFFLYDQQFNNGRNLVSNQVLTDTARNGVFRYFPGWNPANAAFVNPTTFPQNTGTQSYTAVDYFGNPLPTSALRDNVTGGAYTQSLTCFSIFGNIKADGTPFGAADCPGGNAVVHAAWDTLRPNMDSTGYMQKVLSMTPHANNFAVLNVGDGLNTAANRYLRTRKGSNTVNGSIGVVTSAADYNNRKQFNTKIDHNFNKNNRVSFGWTYEMVDSVGFGQAAWDGGWNGATRRRPQVLTVNGTSTLTANLVNEARFGVNYSSEWASPPWANLAHPDTTELSREMLLQGGANPTNGKVYPVIFNPGGNYNGFMSFGAFDFANTSPLWNYADTVRWTHGKHAFSFGGEYRRPMTTGFNSTAYASSSPGNPAGVGAPPLSNIANFTAELPGMLQTARNNAVNQTYAFNASVGTASTPYWIDNYADLQSAKWRDTTITEDIIHTGDPNYGHQARTQISNEWSLFAKDDFKITKSLTLNLGIRYDINMSPYLRGGVTNRFVGDGAGLYGVGRPASGDLLANWMTPGSLYLSGYGSAATTPLSCVVGQQQNTNLPVSTCDPNLMSVVEFVGPSTPNPDKTLIPQSGRFSPAIGFAWQVPWFGEGKTTMRGGFQRTYGGAGSQFSGGLTSGPGGDATNGAINVNDPATAAILATGRALNIGDMATLVPGIPTRAPGRPIPIAARSVNISYSMYADDYVTPYTDNFTLSVTRNVNSKLTIDFRFVDTIGKKLPGTAGPFTSAGSVDLNLNNVYHNPELFQALENTRKGLDDPFFDSMLIGLNLNPTVATFGPVGQTVGGILQRGSAQLRRNTTFATNLANGNYSAVVNSLIGFAPTSAGGATVNNLAQPLPIDPTTGTTVAAQQRLLRNGCDRLANSALSNSFVTPQGTVTARCFPENFIITNPQLSGAMYAENNGKSNYQSGQFQFTVRPVQGVSIQGTYSLSKTMSQPGNGFTDPLNRKLDYAASLNSVGQEFRSNGTIELPIGPNKLLMGNSSGWVARLVENWQTSFIYTLPQGSLRSIVANNMLYANGRPDIVGPWDNPKGEVSWQDGPSGNYFGSPSPYATYLDPQCTANVGGLDAMGTNLQTSCTLRGLGKVVPAGTPGSIVGVSGASVLPLLQQALPGHQGNLGANTMHTVSRWTLDASISKRFRINETKAIQIRVDTTNIMNHPTPGDPTGLANQNSFSDNFGQITSKSGNRTFQGQARFTF